MTINPNLPPQFWDNVVITATCWEWDGKLNKPSGYGWFYFEGKQRLAHRLVVEPIPPGAFVLHRCDNPKCVNPDHLFFGTAKDNALDAVSKNRDSAFKKAKLTPGAVEYIRTLPRNMEVAREMAAKYGVSESLINQVQNNHVWKRVPAGPPQPRAPHRHGEAAGNARLSEGDVHAIRRAPAGKGSAKALSRTYGVAEPTVYAIRNGRSWVHLPWEEGVVPCKRHRGPARPKAPRPPKPVKEAPRKLTHVQKRRAKIEARKAKRRPATEQM